MSYQRRITDSAALIVFLGIFTTACAGRNAGFGSPSDEEMGAPAWTGQLLSRGTAYISGNAQLRPSSDEKSMFVTISVLGPPSTTMALGWSLERGLCGSPGVLMGRPGDYPAIVIHSDGTGEATASIDELVPTTGAFSIRLFNSPAPNSRLLSCGDLTKR